MIDLILFICALIAIGLFISDVMTRRKERKARNDYIDEIEKSICKTSEVDDRPVKTEEEIWCDYRETMYNAWAEQQKKK